MNKRKILLDIIMIILMIILMNLKIVGLKLHEMIGISIALLFIIHKIINYKVLKSMKNLFLKNKLKAKSKIMFILDIILFILVVLSIITGIMISKVLFSIPLIKRDLFITLHHFFSWWSFILISIHLGIHLDIFINYLKKKILIFNNKILKILIILLSILFVIFGMISISNKSIYTKIIPTTISEKQNNFSYHYQNRGGKRNYLNKQYKNLNKYRYQNKITILNIISIFWAFSYITFVITKKVTNKKI